MPMSDSSSLFGSGESGTVEAGPSCPTPPLQTPNGFQFAPAFANLYRIYFIGKLFAITTLNDVSGTVVSPKDPNTLVFAQQSGGSLANLVSMPVTRDSCGHIIALSGQATPFASGPVAAPQVDTLQYGPNNVLFLGANPRTPSPYIAEVPVGESAPTYSVDLSTLGDQDNVTNDWISALAFVPPNLQDPLGLRILDQSGRWFHATYSVDQTWYSLTALQQTQILLLPPGQSGAWSGAYVPNGSPGFAEQSFIAPAGFDATGQPTVFAYPIDGQGNPQVANKIAFAHYSGMGFITGISFEPKTGDFLFTANSLEPDGGVDAGSFGLYSIQGFVPPPPLTQ